MKKYTVSLLWLFAVISQRCTSFGEVSTNIRHSRSRSHLTRSNHRNDDISDHQPYSPTTRVVRSNNGYTSPVPDSSTVTDNVLTGQMSGEELWHPKDDAEETDDDLSSDPLDLRNGMVDIVTRFLRIVESQQQLGENCTAGTDLNLGEGVVDRYAQERFRVEADVAVNRANMLTRLWKYAGPEIMKSEYLLHAGVFSMVEFDDDIFAAGNCYDQYQFKEYWLFCPYAYRLPEGPILVKDLAVEYKYLSNTSEWFYIARKNAENVINNYNQFSREVIEYFKDVRSILIRKYRRPIYLIKQTEQVIIVNAIRKGKSDDTDCSPLHPTAKEQSYCDP